MFAFICDKQKHFLCSFFRSDRVEFNNTFARHNKSKSRFNSHDRNLAKKKREKENFSSIWGGKTFLKIIQYLLCTNWHTKMSKIECSTNSWWKCLKCVPHTILSFIEIVLSRVFFLTKMSWLHVWMLTKWVEGSKSKIFWKKN